MEVNSFSITPTEGQLDALRSLFVIPLKLLAIYSRRPVAFKNIGAARQFLVAHKDSLCATPELADQYERAFYQLVHMLFSWRNKTPEIAIRINKGWAITETGGVVLPWGVSGELHVARPSKLLSLVEYSDIEHLELCASLEGFLLRTCSQQKDNAKVEVPAKQGKGVFSEILTALQGAVCMARRMEEAIGRSTAHCDFNRLEGRPLPGGLPSLGHRH